MAEVASGDKGSCEPEWKRIRACHHEEPGFLLSMEAMLAVPPEVLCRRVGTKADPEPLFTWVEAACFLEIALLAQELDVFFEMAQEALSHRHFCQTRNRQHSKHQQLHPIVPTVHLVEDLVKLELQHVKHKVGALLAGLAGRASALRQLAEQNWTLSDSLFHAGAGSSLVQEKNSLANLEEELAQRIGIILALPSHSPVAKRIVVQGGTCTGEWGVDKCHELFRDICGVENPAHCNSWYHIEPVAIVARHLLGVLKRSEETGLTNPPLQSSETKHGRILEPRPDDVPTRVPLLQHGGTSSLSNSLPLALLQPGVSDGPSRTDAQGNVESPYPAGYSSGCSSAVTQAVAAIATNLYSDGSQNLLQCRPADAVQALATMAQSLCSDESQNPGRCRSTAAEALAALALGVRD